MVFALCLALGGCASQEESWVAPETPSPAPEPSWGGDEGAAEEGYAPLDAPAEPEPQSLRLEVASRMTRHDKQASARVSAPPGAPGPAAAPPSAGAPASPAESAVMTDGRTGPLLIYKAQLRMAAYKIEETQRQVIAVVKELGGYMTEQEDQQRLVLRVPAQQFGTALERIEAIGQVTQRYVKAQDVTDAFRDLEMRLRNAEAFRDRLLSLLAKAADVPQSLAVEEELDRVGERIELLKGQLKAMGDQIAFSTISIGFHVKSDETINPEFRLPFEWLRHLGLQHLLSLPSP